MQNLLCPDCGSDTFEQTRTTRTRFEIQALEGYGLSDLDDGFLVDSGERGDDPVTCVVCGYEVEEGDLVPEEVYSAGEYT